MDKLKIENNFKEILENLNENGEIVKEVIENTPKRMADLYEDIFQGLKENPLTPLKRKFLVESNDIVIEKNIRFYSMCEHHLLPFFGEISIGYIPNGEIVGFGDIIKVIEILTKRPQLQERLGEEIAKAIYEGLNCHGAIVHMEAEHLCMTMRGAKKFGTKIVTLTCKGSFQENEEKMLFLSLIK